MDTQKIKPQYRVAKLSGIGFIGLLCGLIVMCYDSFFDLCLPSPHLFHEISYHPRELVNEAIDHLLDSLKQDVSLLDPKLGQKNPAPSTDSTTFWTVSRTFDTTSIITLRQDKNSYQDAGLGDSVSLAQLNNLIHLDIIPENLVSWEKEFEDQGYEWKTSVRYWIRIPGISPQLTHSGITQLTVENPLGNMAFFAKYPEVATFIFLIAVFCSFCAIAVSTSIVTAHDIFKLIEHENIVFFKSTFFKQRPFYFMWVIILAALALLALTVGHSFNDELPVKSLFFRRHLNVSLSMLNFIGYTTAACCLAGFIYTASVLGFLHQSVGEKKAAMAKTTDEAQKTDLDGQKKILENTYFKLLGYFNKYFVLSAVILSLTVLCTGALFNAINSFDFVRLLASNWGYSPLRGDIVYLYGGMYMAILLLVYLPARLRFNEIRLEMQYRPEDPGAAAADAVPPQQGAQLDLVKDTFSLVRGTLLVASPLLAGIIQKLLDLLFQH